MGSGASPVVVLTPWFPNHPGDQNAAYIFDSAAALARRGSNVSVLVCRPMVPRVFARYAPEWMRGDVDCARFPDLNVSVVRYVSLPGGVLRSLTNLSQGSAVIGALERLVQKTRATVIHAQTEGMAPLALAVGRKLKVPVVASIHGLNMDPRYLNDRRQRAFLAPALHDVARMILVGEPLRKTFQDYTGRGDHIRVVPNGVRMPASSFAPRFGGGPLRLVSVSNLHEGKGVDITLRALAELKTSGLTAWTYSIVGGGAQRQPLESLTRQLGLEGQVSFLGPKSHREVFAILDRSDVFVLPSYREAFGIAYLEAMASGLVVIGVSGQGPEAFIEHGRTGYLVEPRSPRAVAECLRTIATRPEEARVVGEHARHAAQSFTWDAHADRLLTVYIEAIAAESA